ncbi:MAG: PAS domain S-box protein [Dehalococcoidia bacterium]
MEDRRGWRPKSGTVLSPLSISLAYCLLSIAWILFSDRFTEFIPDRSVAQQVQSIKGVGFVLGTTVLMLALISRYRRRILRVAEEMVMALSQLRRQQAALERSEERHRSLIEQSSDGIFVLNPDGAIIEANAAGAALLGSGVPEIVGRPWADLIDPDDLRAHPTRLGQLDPGQSMLFKRRLRRRDGSTVTVELSLKRLTDGRFVHVARDITERMAAEAERGRLVDSLRTSEADLAEAQRIARVGSWTLDPATGAATWSAEMYRILGVDPAGPPIDLSDISRLFTPDSVRDVTDAVERAVRTGESWILDLEAVRPDGAHSWVSSHGVVELDEGGAVVKIRGTMQDVTEQRRLEADLRQAQRLEGVGQLAGGLAHDFNNLLTAIRGYAELVRRNLGSDEKSSADVDQVILAADRAAELTRQLLAFSRRQVLQPRVVDPAAIVAGIAPLLRRLLGEHVELVTHAAPGLGRVKVDPSQFEQVILNLAVNARDAMPDGGTLTIETMNVELDAAYATNHADAQPGPHVALIVSDTGTGIEEATRSRIFEPFFTTKEPGEGTGMGLATVYGIVKQSGGSIYVYSEPGHGTSFKVYLPRLEEEAIPQQPSVLAPAVRGGPEVVLLVEDEAAVRAFAARVLGDLGYTVMQAASGTEALAIAAADTGPIQLLVTDVIMPGLQGHQLALELAAERPDLRVLYVSGFTENSVIHHGVANDGVSFLPKPFTAEALARAVRLTLDGRE